MARCVSGRAIGHGHFTGLEWLERSASGEDLRHHTRAILPYPGVRESNGSIPAMAHECLAALIVALSAGVRCSVRFDYQLGIGNVEVRDVWSDDVLEVYAGSGSGECLGKRVEQQGFGASWFGTHLAGESGNLFWCFHGSQAKLHIV